MADIFGYNKTIRGSEQLGSADAATIYIGDNINLGQNVTVNYTQEVRPVFEIGSSNLYWVTGHSQGQAQIERLVGSGWNAPGGECGVIETMTIGGGSSSGNPCAGSVGRMTMTGCRLENYGCRISAGQIEVFENIGIRIGSLSV